MGRAGGTPLPQWCWTPPWAGRAERRCPSGVQASEVGLPTDRSHAGPLSDARRDAPDRSRAAPLSGVDAKIMSYSASVSSSTGRLSTKTVIETIRSSSCGFMTVTPREARR